MPTKHVHQDKQRIAQRALTHLQAPKKSTNHADWIVTLAFYKALHAVDSYLDKFNIHPSLHTGPDGRNKSVRQHLKSIFKQYSALHRASIRARYRDFTYQNKPQEVGNLLKMSSDTENHIKTLI